MFKLKGISFATLAIVFASFSARADFSSSSKELTEILADVRVLNILATKGELTTVNTLFAHNGTNKYRGFELITEQNCSVYAFKIPINSTKSDFLISDRGCK